MAALGLINSNGTGAAALGQIKINLVPKVIVPKGHDEKKKERQKAQMAFAGFLWHAHVSSKQQQQQQQGQKQGLAP